MNKFLSKLIALVGFVVGVFLTFIVTKNVTGSPIFAAFATCAMTLIAVVQYYTFDFQTPTRLFVQFYPRYWVSVFLDKFYPKMDFIRRGMDMTAMVRNEGIYIDELSTEPEVYIDPSTPIGTVDVVDETYYVPLRTFHTQNTRISYLDQLQTIWDKAKAYIMKHQKAIYAHYVKYFLYNVAPATDGTFTPIIAATGAATGSNNLKAMKIADIIMLQQKYDEADMPTEGRVLVLNPKHAGDLLREDSVMYRAFLNAPQGDMPKQLYGFDIYSSTATPYYDGTTNTKVPFTAAILPQYAHASVAWLESEVFYADGATETYYLPRQQNTTMRADEFGISKRFLVMPIRNKGLGAIVSYA